VKRARFGPVAAVVALLACTWPPRATFAGELASVHHVIATHSIAAQRAFDDGLFMLEAFDMGEARLRFRRAATLDPTCAMAS